MLWKRLRNRRLSGRKFVRQVPIGPYVADFVCREAHLVVEVDGSGHSRHGVDSDRDRFMLSDGYSVLCFWNSEVFLQIESVCETIVAALEGRLEPFERFVKTDQV